MNKCVKCGANFVIIPEQPLPDGQMCKSCKIEELAKQVESLQRENDELRKELDKAWDVLGMWKEGRIPPWVQEKYKAKFPEPWRQVKELETEIVMRSIREAIHATSKPESKSSPAESPRAPLLDQSDWTRLQEPPTD